MPSDYDKKLVDEFYDKWSDGGQYWGAVCNDLAALIERARKDQCAEEVRHLPVTRTVVRTALVDLASATRKLKKVEAELSRIIDAEPQSSGEEG